MTTILLKNRPSDDKRAQEKSLAHLSTEEFEEINNSNRSLLLYVNVRWGIVTVKLTNRNFFSVHFGI